jgi:predicted transposase YbfD/YdcC
MDSTPLKDTIFDSFALIDDPRAANAAHPLITVLFCLIVAVISGADGFVQAEHIARLKKRFIKKYVPLRRDVPTHDTLARVLGDLDPDQFVSAFATFMERLTGRPAKDIINIDGKTLRGVVGAAAVKRANAMEQAHIISAFSSLRGLVLGQLRSKSVQNEVLAAQELMQILDIRGAVITLDAAHTIPRTLEIALERDADVVVAVKGNVETLHGEVVNAFRGKQALVTKTIEDTHGTTETRKYEIVAATKTVAETRFAMLKSFVRVTRENVSHSALKQEHERETYYASTLPTDDAALIAKCIRARWSIENQAHYVLDVTFREDHSRIRSKNAPENFSRVRHIALGLLSLAKTPKLSFALKRATALADDRYLARVLRLKPR